jgi:hypothetical protein
MTNRRSVWLSAVFAASLIGPVAWAQEALHLNRTVETLAGGKPAFGLFSGDFSLANARALAASELDFVFIDMEHSPFDVETLHAFLLGMTDKGRLLEKGNLQMDVTPLVRIPMNGRESLQWQVKQVLDAGAFGIVFPYVETREEAENAIRSMRYPQRQGDAAMEPGGLRGARPAGQPISCCIATKSSKSDSPVITSGMTSGAVDMPVSSARDRNRPNRVSTYAASVPSPTASVALTAATCRLIQADPRICGSRSSSPYHLVEKPPQTVTSLLSLKLKMISDRIGA